MFRKPPPPQIRQATGFRIGSIWAWLAIDEDDEEGVCGFLVPDGTWMPLVMADKERMDAVRPMAEEIAAARGMKLVLARFDQRTDVDTIDGRRRRGV